MRLRPDKGLFNLTFAHIVSMGRRDLFRVYPTGLRAFTGIDEIIPKFNLTKRIK